MRKTMFIVLIFLFFMNSHARASVGAQGTAGSPEPALLHKAFKTQIPFIQNIGQIDDTSVKFFADTFAGRVLVTGRHEIVYRLIRPGSTEHEKETSAPEVFSLIESLECPDRTDIRGISRSDVRVNSFTGAKDIWRSNIPAWNSVSLGEVYSGIELELIAHGDNVEKLFTVYPGGNADDIKLKIHDAEKLHINKDGELEVETEAGTVRFSRPVAYQEIAGKKVKVSAEYHAASADVYGFTVGDYDRSEKLVIDPLLASTFIGGGKQEDVYGLAMDPSGDIFVAGNLWLTAFTSDINVFKLNSTLTSLLSSTTIGGDNIDFLWSLDMDTSGNVYLSGETKSSDYPTTAGAYSGTLSGDRDVFITKINNDLSAIVASTYVGGTGYERGTDIAIPASGDVLFAGYTSSSDYPASLDQDSNDVGAFVSKLDSGLSNMLSSVRVGGSSSEEAAAIGLDPAGNVFVTGRTDSSDFPATTGAYDETYHGNGDTFVTKLDSGLSSILSSTFLGGVYVDQPNALDTDDSGNVFVAGSTYSFDYPLTGGAYSQVVDTVSPDVFVAKFNNDLSVLVSSSRFGGMHSEEASDISIDSIGNVFVVGQTGSPDFPTTAGAYQGSFNSLNTSFSDSFVSRLNNDLTVLMSSTFVGGTYADNGSRLALDPADNVYIAGQTGSHDYPTTSGAYDESYGFVDIFVSNLSTGLIALDQNPVNFGGIDAGGTLDKTLTVRNDGASNLSIGSIAQADPLNANFSIVTDNCSEEVLPSMSNCTVIIRFSPPSKGSFTETFDIPSNDPYDSSITVDLYGIVADEDFETGDLGTFPWVSKGRGAWLVQTSEKFTGNYAATPPSISNYEASVLETTLTTTTDGDVSFWFKVSSQENNFFLRFDIDGVEQNTWSGAEGWEYASFPVTAGRHTFSWEYTKGSYMSAPAGSDAAWIDDITFPDHMPPRKISGQVTNGALGGVNVVFMDVTGTISASTKTDSSGNYNIFGLTDGDYTITPSKDGYTFLPASRNITISGSDISGIDFSVEPPVTDVSPSQFDFTVLQGGSKVGYMSIADLGSGDLKYNIITSTTATSSSQTASSGTEQVDPMAQYNKMLSIDKAGKKRYRIPKNAAYSNDYILVKFKDGVAAANKAKIHGNAGGSVVKKFKRSKALKIRVKKGKVKDAINMYLSDPAVEYAEPDYVVKTTFTPDDLDSRLWALNNTGQTGGQYDSDIDGLEAWDINTGSSSTVVAVIDTGVYYDHEDLADNIWTNDAELNGTPGVDDDANGYIDDVHGIDTCNYDSDPMDDNGHGTHCAGTIGAVGNNGIGVVGVNWDVKIMPLKFLCSNGTGYTSDAIPLFEYAIANGARVMSNSWSGSGFSQALKNVIEDANNAGVLVVAAAGNNGCLDNDQCPAYPASYDNDNIISVAATDHFDELAYFSHYGAATVDLAAPGVDIYSTFPPGASLSSNCNDNDADGYGYCLGTSMAAPHVSGVAALVWSKNPGLPIDTVKASILDSVDPVPALGGKMVTGGRLNARAALEASGPPWLSLSQYEGIITPGTAEFLDVYAAASSWLTLGTYTADIEIHSNDPANPTVTVPVSLTIDTDSDGDGMPDSWETRHGLDAYDPSDADCASGCDMDGDGLTNLEEYEAGTDPTDQDTDNDGYNDWSDVCPTVDNPDQTDTDSDGIGDECDSCPLISPVKVGASFYPSLQSAYNAAADQDYMQIQDFTFVENFDVNLAKTVYLQSGFDCGYSAETGSTRLKGNMNIFTGKIIFDSGTFVLE